MMRNQCGCELGENCTKTTVCANEMVVEDLQAEIERLTAALLEIVDGDSLNAKWYANKALGKYDEKS